MSGYALHVRLRRPGAVTERTLAVSDAGLARLGRGALFGLGILLFLLAPFAMASVGGWNQLGG